MCAVSRACVSCMCDRLNVHGSHLSAVAAGAMCVIYTQISCWDRECVNRINSLHLYREICTSIDVISCDCFVVCPTRSRCRHLLLSHHVTSCRMSLLPPSPHIHTRCNVLTSLSHGMPTSHLRMDARSNPLAWTGLRGITTFSPGVCAK